VEAKFAEIKKRRPDWKGSAITITSKRQLPCEKLARRGRLEIVDDSWALGASVVINGERNMSLRVWSYCSFQMQAVQGISFVGLWLVKEHGKGMGIRFTIRKGAN
jgi:hypothetical protein